MKDAMKVSIILFILKSITSFSRWRFLRTLSNPRKVQEQTLKKILAYYQGTQFGKELALTTDKQYSHFKNIPIHNYEDLKVYFDQEFEHFSKRILKEMPICWELTSGSSGVKKKIPYTKEIFNCFQDLVLIWLSDLLANGPQYKGGKIFFSISPKSVTDENNTIEDDLEFLPKIIATPLSKLFINPKGLKEIHDHHDYKMILALSLLEQRSLEIMFIWSPTYLLSLIDFIKKNQEVLFKTAQAGEYLNFKFQFQPETLNLLEKKLDFSLIWPELQFISCWADASSSLFINQIKALFSKVMIQPKGLIATEAVMTIPLEDPTGCFPLLRHNFYEFMDEMNNIFPIWELEKNKEYNIIISNLSGLLRYEIGDRVKVVSYYKKTPQLEFVGRAKVVDITGEKLNELVIQNIFSKLNTNNEKSFMFPVILDDEIYYQCLTNSPDENYAQKLERELLEIFHYQESRRNNQLQHIRVQRIEDILDVYYEYFVSQGMILGDIKFSCLIKNFKQL